MNSLWIDSAVNSLCCYHDLVGVSFSDSFLAVLHVSAFKGHFWWHRNEARTEETPLKWSLLSNVPRQGRDSAWDKGRQTAGYQEGVTASCVEMEDSGLNSWSVWRTQLPSKAEERTFDRFSQKPVWSKWNERSMLRHRATQSHSFRKLTPSFTREHRHWGYGCYLEVDISNFRVGQLRGPLPRRSFSNTRENCQKEMQKLCELGSQFLPNLFDTFRKSGLHATYPTAYVWFLLWLSSLFFLYLTPNYFWQDTEGLLFLSLYLNVLITLKKNWKASSQKNLTFFF